MVRLKDIAEAADVSISLASKVLNNVKGNAVASAKTTALIRETAKRMGYVRNRSAASLVAGRQNAIGLIMHPAGMPGSEIVQNFLIGLARSASGYQQRLEMEFYYSPEELQSALVRLNESVVDGLIIYGFDNRVLHDVLGPYVSRPVPIVGIFEDIVSPEIPTLLNDGTIAIRLATEHLILQGCRKIAHIGTWPRRVLGYRETLEKHNISYDDSLVYLSKASAYSHQIGEDGVANLFFRDVEFDAIVCQCDVFAVGAMRALLAKGVRIPEDVKIVGSDNASFCDMAPVPLSSVYIDSTETARLATDLLMNRIKGDSSMGSMALLPELKPRRSTDIRVL